MQNISTHTSAAMTLIAKIQPDLITVSEFATNIVNKTIFIECMFKFGFKALSFSIQIVKEEKHKEILSINSLLKILDTICAELLKSRSLHHNKYCCLSFANH